MKINPIHNKKNNQYQGTAVLEILEGADEYNKWIIERIKPEILCPALEIGSGVGNISFYLKNCGNLSLSDIDESLINKLKKKFNKDIQVYKYDIEKPCPPILERNLRQLLELMFLNILKMM